MTTKRFYDHPNFTISREQVGARAGGAASTLYSPFRMFQAGTLIAAHIAHAVSGTTASAMWEVMLNAVTFTTALVFSLTNITGSVHTFEINRAVTSLTDVFQIKSGIETVQQVDVVWEYKVDYPGNETA